MNIFVFDAAAPAGMAMAREFGAGGHAVTVMTAAANRQQAERDLPSARRVHAMDMTDQQAVARTMDGCDVLALAAPLHPDMKKMANTAIKAAASVGLEHILCSSCAGASFDAHWRLGREYGFVDLIAEESGIPFTVLRPNVFMQEILAEHGPSIRERSLLRLPHGKARVSFMDARDLGICARAVLENREQHAGKTYALTGPDSLSGQELAELLADAAQKPIRWEEQPEADYSRQLSDAGADPWVVEMLVSRSRIIRRDMAWNVTGAVSFLAGRQPRSFAQFAREHSKSLR